jgi:hypothetical protein
MEERLFRTNAIIATPSAQTLPRIWTLPNLLARDWAYVATGQRDLRIDLLRGFAVFAMVANHFGGASWLYLITGGDTFMVSAAEAFIFISGVTVGIVYGALALKEGLRAAQVKAFKRALTLYKLAVVLTLLFAAVSLLFKLPWSSGIQIDNPLVFVLNVATLRQTMYLTDIPLMYTFLMLAAPVGLWLLVKGRTLALMVASSALWLAFQLFPAQVQVPWPIVGNTTFNLAAWQLLFFSAMAIGFHRNMLARKIGALPRVPYMVFMGVLLVWLVQSNATASTVLTRLIPGLDTTTFMSEFFLKSALGPGRLLASAILFQFAFLAVTILWKPIAAAFGWLLLPLGQSALYGYTLHVAIIGLFYAILPYLPGNVTAMGTLNTALQLSAILMIWAMIERRFLFRFIPR